MTICREPEIGALLHAYELDILPAVDIERFEIHLMHCDACRQAVADFERHALALRASSEARQLASQGAAVREDRSRRDSGIWARLWPKAPLLLRPGFLYTAIVILLLPAALGLSHLVTSDDRSRTVQLIRLLPNRALTDNTLHLNSNADGVVSFGVANARPGARYDVSVLSDNGVELGRWRTESVSDSQAVLSVLIPRKDMIEGVYRLTVTESDGAGKSPVAEFRLKIE